MTNHARQSELYARLEEVLGRQPAETLMTMLPISDQYATKADLADLATKGDLSGLRQDVRELRSELKSLVRTFVVAQTTAMIGLTGIFIGVNQLL